MKVAPLCEEFQKKAIPHFLVHTGQHYDEKMCKLFFEELGLPKPDVNLGVGSATHAQQTAEIMKRLEPVLEQEKPSLVIVVGDVNSTMAATITAAKMGIPVAHVESGLRSFDRSMPEEINRLVTDSVADYHFTTEESANQNLRNEGVAPERIFFVGNTMIDTLLKHSRGTLASPILQNIGVEAGKYGVVTLHRPSNVDSTENLRNILDALSEIARHLPLIFPVHPRTRGKMSEMSFSSGLQINTGDAGINAASCANGIILSEPLGYLDFLTLMKDAKIVLTDSGGIQEETTVLGVPCLTLRENTERPVTISEGTNILVGANKDKIVAEAKKSLNGSKDFGSIPYLWDGRAAERIVDIIVNGLGIY